MRVEFNIDKIKRLLSDISVLTGISISLVDCNYNILANCKDTDNFCYCLQKAKRYNDECRLSDKKVLDKCIKSGKIECHICHAGLCDFAMPLIKNDITAGYVVMGQIRCKDSPLNYIGNYKLKNLYNKIPYFSDRQIEGLKNLLPQILFNDAIDIIYDCIIDEVAQYIDLNLQNDLSISALCKKFNVSKNYLYSGFRKNFNCTVNEYIIYKKIEKAKSLLKKTDMTVYAISDAVGIENYTYFSKLFKNKVGITPSKYRSKK